MSRLNPQTIRNLGIYGLIRQKEVDDYLIPDGAVTEVINFNFDRKGVAQVRPGMSAIGSTVSAGTACIGLHNIQSNTAIAVFTATASSTIYERQSSSWVAIGAGIGTGVLRFVDFANRTLMFGPAERSIKIYAGSSFSDYSGDPINPDDLWYTNGNTNAGCLRVSFGEVYKSRVYLAGDTNYSGYGSRLWFSSVISSSGAISWTPNTDFVDINPSDGENISALKRYNLALLIFKPNYIYRFLSSSTDPDPIIKIGTRSQESIVEGKKGLYFHHDNGFYRYSGDYPVEISRAISDVVEAIPRSQFDTISSWKDSDHIYWSIGDVTIGDAKGSSVWTNVVVRYTESAELWTIYSYSNEIRRGVPWITGTTNSIIVGLDNGVVCNFNSGVSDLGEPIKYRMTTKWYEWENMENRKQVSQIVAFAEKGMGMNVMYQTDDYNDWKALSPDLRKLISYLDFNAKFHRIRFKVAGVSGNESPVLLGFTMTEGINEGIIKE